MLIYIGVYLAGAATALLVVRRNLKIAAWFYKAASKVEKVIEDKTGKNI